MQRPEGAVEGAEGGARYEETVEEKPVTMAGLMVLLVGIQQELRDRCDNHTRELAEARQEHEAANESWIARLDDLETSVRTARGEMCRMSDRLDGLQPPAAGDTGGAGRLTPPAHVSPIPTPPVAVTPPPPANATSPPAAPAFTSTPAASRPAPAAAPGATPRRPRPQDFDGRVSLEAYLAQFELLAQAQAWDDQEKAVQLAASLKGPAVEVLGQMSAAQRGSYATLVGALERRYGHQHQAEAFRARFRSRVRASGETLQMLAQDLEHLVRKAYPGAPENTTSILLRDQFVDALQDQQLQIYVLQAHVVNMQQALARALEYESFIKKGVPGVRKEPKGETYVRRNQMRGRGQLHGRFGGRCWGCGQQGHRRHECTAAPRSPRSLSADRGRQGSPSPCCWECGETGHLARTCPTAGVTRRQGNGARLGQRGVGQPRPSRPHSR